MFSRRQKLISFAFIRLKALLVLRFNYSGFWMNLSILIY